MIDDWTQLYPKHLTDNRKPINNNNIQQLFKDERGLQFLIPIFRLCTRVLWNHTSIPLLQTSMEYNDELNSFLDISHAEIEATNFQQKNEALIAVEFVKIFKEDLKNILKNALTQFQSLKLIMKIQGILTTYKHNNN
jgi:hypothetical protein